MILLPCRMVVVETTTTALCMHQPNRQSTQEQQFPRPCRVDIRPYPRPHQLRYSARLRYTTRFQFRRSARRQWSLFMEKHLRLRESRSQFRIPVVSSMTSKASPRHILPLCQRPRPCRLTKCHIHWFPHHDFKAISTRCPMHHKSLCQPQHHTHPR